MKKRRRNETQSGSRNQRKERPQWDELLIAYSAKERWLTHHRMIGCRQKLEREKPYQGRRNQQKQTDRQTTDEKLSLRKILSKRMSANIS